MREPYPTQQAAQTAAQALVTEINKLLDAYDGDIVTSSNNDMFAVITYYKVGEWLNFIKVDLPLSNT